MKIKHTDVIIPFFIPFEGCTYTCVYCDQRKISNSNTPDIERTLNDYFTRHPDTGNTIEAAFFGGTFTCLPIEQQERYLSQVKPFVENGLISGIRCSTRPDGFAQADFSFYKENGLTHFELGVQSFDPRYLSFLGRNYTLEDIAQAIELIMQHDCTFGIQLMCAFPAQTGEDFMQDIQMLIRYQPVDCRLYPLAVIEGTALARHYHDEPFAVPPLETVVSWLAEAAFAIEMNDITILRMGLPHSVELAASVIGGTYHPSLADLVRYEQIKRSLDDVGAVSHITVHPKDEQYARKILSERSIKIFVSETVQRGKLIY